MKISFIGILLTLGLLWGGGQGLYTAVANRSPAEFSLPSYLQTRPKAKWLRLTGGVFDLSEMAYSGGRLSKTIREVYLPLVPEGGTGNSAQVQVLVSSRDPALLELAGKLRDAQTAEEGIKLLLKYDGAFRARPVEGLVRFGIDLKDKEARKLRELNPSLSEDFVLLDEGKRPELGLSLLLFGGGLLLAFFMIKGLVAPTPVSPPLTATPSAGSGTPPPLPPA